MSVRVKVSERSLKDAEKGIREAIDRTMKQTNLLAEIGETVQTDIRFQTRRGFSIPLNGRFSSLTESWKKLRERIAKSNETHPAFGKNRSNLTITGQLLDAVFFRVNKSKYSVDVEVNNERHKPYTVSRKTETRVRAHGRGSSQVRSHTRRLSPGQFKVGESKTNREIADQMSDQGRPFMGVRPQIVKRIQILARQSIRRIFKSLRIDAS